MLQDKRILVTGVTGKAVLPIAAALARDNEVWGQGRFLEPASRTLVESLGIRPCVADLATGDLSDLPGKVDYLLHFAWWRGLAEELDAAMRVNVDGGGLMLHHCRDAKAALVVSSLAIYSPAADPWHPFKETDPVSADPMLSAATSGACKLGLEAMGRFAGRAYGLPVTIARLCTVLGPHQAYYGKQTTAVLKGDEIVLPGDPNPHSAIHVNDMIDQIEPLLGAAGREALTVNWCGDEAVTNQDTIARIAERTGRTPRVRVASRPGFGGGAVCDADLRRSITGPCRTRFWDGFERMLDEMVDGVASPIPQRSWTYSGGPQNHMFKGA